MRRENWDWFSIQKEATEEDIYLKLFVVNIGGTFFICIFCLILLLVALKII